jgi:hypothetical protein
VSENSKISANAQNAFAGNININTTSLFQRNTQFSVSSALGNTFAGTVQINSGSKQLTEPNLPNLALKDPEIQALCRNENPRLAVQSLSGQLIPVNPVANSQPNWSLPASNPTSTTEQPTLTPAVGWKTNSDGTISFVRAEEYLERLQTKLCTLK